MSIKVVMTKVCSDLMLLGRSALPSANLSFRGCYIFAVIII